jgi:hypothetical protein
VRCVHTHILIHVYSYSFLSVHTHTLTHTLAELIYESPQAHVITGLKRFSLFGCSMGLVSAPFLWSLAIAKGIPVVPSAILSYCGAAVGITTTTRTYSVLCVCVCVCVFVIWGVF